MESYADNLDWIVRHSSDHGGVSGSAHGRNCSVMLPAANQQSPAPGAAWKAIWSLSGIIPMTRRHH